MVDVTIKTAPRTIRLKGKGRRIERAAGGTVTPGALVKLNSSDQLVVHATAGGSGAPIFAVENELLGLGIDDDYVSGDFAQAEHFGGGDWVLAYVAAAASAIVIGDQLESAGDGSLCKLASGTPLGVAMQAVDNSAGGAIARIQVALI